jgi:RNA polymerase sigma-70 factor (ECF subfamily)
MSLDDVESASTIPEPELAALIARARERWPSFVVAPAVFAAWLDERLPGREAPIAELRAARAEDLYLACACASGDAAAIAAFETSYAEPIDAILRRYRRAVAAIDELKQRLRVRLLVADGDRPAIIRQYAGRGELLSFVRVVASRTALMYLRRQSAPSVGCEDLAASVADEGDVELAHLKQLYREHFRQALALAVDHLEARQRTLLRYQLCDSLTIDQIGAIYRVHRATAARWLAQARAQLIRSVYAELGKRLEVSPRELDDILRLVQSRLDVTVERLLRTRSLPR